MKKIVVILLLCSFVLIGSQSSSYASSNNNEARIESRKNIVRWRFKNINGHAYKRLYDYSTKKWIGNWIRV